MEPGNFSTLDGLGAAEWGVGDRLLAAIAGGQPAFEAKTAAARALRLCPSDVNAIITVCAAFPSNERVTDISFAHHAAVVRLKQASRSDFLQRAIAEGWSARRLRREVLAYRVASGDYVPPFAEDDLDDRGYRSIAQAWNRSSINARALFQESLDETGTGDVVL